MKKIELVKCLSDIGFSKWEIEAYLALLRHGAKTAVELARLTGVARSKTYEVVTRLRRKGFVMKVPPMPTKGVTQKFVAIDPEGTFSKKIDDIKQLSLHLKEMYENPIQARFPDINFHTSKESVKQLLFHAIKESKLFYLYLIDSNIENILGYSFEHFIKQVKRKNKHWFVISKKQLKNLPKKIKNKTYTSQTEGINYIITSNSVILDLWKTQHIMIEINSKETVKTFLHMYERLKKENR